MRKIKFRAWDTLKDRMVQVCGIDFGDDLPAVLHSKAKGEVTKSDTMIGARFLLSQFTGLKDKSGKEIYEGDVIEFTGRPNIRYVISFRDGAFGYEKDDDFGMPANLIAVAGCPWDVIGNIYENPEILT